MLALKSVFEKLMITLAVLTMLLPGFVVAQGGLEEVIVTAQKREESLQDVSGSVSALSSEDIARMGIKEGRDVFERLANVSLQTTTSEAQPQISMRGISYQSVQPSAVQPVGLFQDEVSLNSPQLGGMFMFDLERIEVIRGPQNTLYGRNTTGGAINFITRKPVVGEEMTANISTTLGRFDQVDVDAGISFPLGEKAAMRIALNSQDRDGIRDNAFDGDEVEKRDKKNARMQLALEPTETFTSLFNVHWGEMDNTARTRQPIGMLDPANPDGSTWDLEAGLYGNCPLASRGELGSQCVTSQGIVGDSDIDKVNTDLRNPVDRVENKGASMNLVWELPSMTVTSITAYEEVEYNHIRDDGLPITFFVFAQNQDAEQISQEIRFASPQDDRLRWVAGAYYFEEESLTDIIASLPRLMGGMGGGMFSRSEQTDTSVSVFGEVEWDATEKLTATVGFRYSRDTKEGWALAGLTTNTQDFPQYQLGGNAQQPVLVDDLLAVGAPVFADDVLYKETWTDWGGKIGLSYQHTDDVSIYGHISRGIKAGSFPTGPNIILADLNGDAGQVGDGLFNNPVDPETVIAYEVGLKGQWFDNTLRTNLAVFYNDYQDQQLQTFILFEQAEGPPIPEGRLINIGDSFTGGAEAEIVWVPPQIEGATLALNLGYLTTEIEREITGRNLEGNELTNAPEWTASVTASKEWDVEFGGSPAVFSVQLDGRYTGSRFFDINNNPVTHDDSYAVLDAAAHYEFGSAMQYRVSIWGKNLTDEDWFTNMSEESWGGFTVLSNPPPTFGVTFSANFD